TAAYGLVARDRLGDAKATRRRHYWRTYFGNAADVVCSSGCVRPVCWKGDPPDKEIRNCGHLRAARTEVISSSDASPSHALLAEAGGRYHRLFGRPARGNRGRGRRPGETAAAPEQVDGVLLRFLLGEKRCRHQLAS